MQQGIAVKGKDMLWLDTEGAVPVGTTLAFEIKGAVTPWIIYRYELVGGGSFSMLKFAHSWDNPQLCCSATVVTQLVNYY